MSIHRTILGREYKLFGRSENQDKNQEKSNSLFEQLNDITFIYATLISLTHSQETMS